MSKRAGQRTESPSDVKRRQRKKLSGLTAHSEAEQQAVNAYGA